MCLARDRLKQGVSCETQRKRFARDDGGAAATLPRMHSKLPIAPCRSCTSTRFAHVPALMVLGPFVSVAARKIPASRREDRREGRAGEALVCLGCGEIRYFMQSFDTVLQHPGATEVHAEGSGPYR